MLQLMTMGAVSTALAWLRLGRAPGVAQAGAPESSQTPADEAVPG